MKKQVYASLGLAALMGCSLAYAAGTPKSVRVSVETSDARDGGQILLVGEGRDAVKVEVLLQNLDPGLHGIHFHQNPSCDAPSFQSAGGHFNPYGKQHGYKNPKGHHAGDINVNLNVGDNGKVRQTFVVHGVTLDLNAANSLLAHGGTSIIIHNGPDDQKTDPSGNSGGREACGIIAPANGLNSVPDLRKTPPRADPSND